MLLHIGLPIVIIASHKLMQKLVLNRDKSMNAAGICLYLVTSSISLFFRTTSAAASSDHFFSSLLQPQHFLLQKPAALSLKLTSLLALRRLCQSVSLSVQNRPVPTLAPDSPMALIAYLQTSQFCTSSVHLA